MVWLACCVRTGISKSRRRVAHSTDAINDDWGTLNEPKRNRQQRTIAKGVVRCFCCSACACCRFCIPSRTCKPTVRFCFGRDSTDRRLLDWELPVPYVASLHAGLVLAVAPLLARAMARLRSRPGLPAATTKLHWEWLQPALHFVPLAIATLTVSRDSQAGLGWLLACLSLLSVGELLVGALGPSLVLRLAPSNRSSGRWIECVVWLDRHRFLVRRTVWESVGRSTTHAVLHWPGRAVPARCFRERWPCAIVCPLGVSPSFCAVAGHRLALAFACVRIRVCLRARIPSQLRKMCAYRIRSQRHR